ncbi:eukaryotic membrane protein family-domain-containing protein [Geopyxis carbonaria]|nr:eukaryotic membrane protein family-domain-containing protein [Geopyxis carbonaria]
MTDGRRSARDTNGQQHYRTPPPEDDDHTVPRSSAGQVLNGLGIDTPQLARGDRALSSDDTSWKSEAEMGAHTETKVLKKLSGPQLQELLVSTPIVLQPLSPETKSRGRSTTNPTPKEALPPIRPVQGRTLSTPPSVRKARPQNQPLEIITAGGDAGGSVRGQKKERKMEGKLSPQRPTVVHQQLGGDATFEKPRRDSDIDNSSSGRNSGHSSSINTSPSKSHFRDSSSVPQRPFQSYLFRALSSPPVTTPGLDDAYSPNKMDTASSQVYGPSPHNSEDLSAIAMERIMNFFMLPPKLEGALIFGILTCLDSWLYIFTILPLRFLKAIGVLMRFWMISIRDYFHYDGKKLQKKRKGSSPSYPTTPNDKSAKKKKAEQKASDLMPSHKADILKGMVLFISCWYLMRFDASKIYHSVRGQSGIKLYVIYNMLDFSDRLAASLGVDIFECLFSKDSLERRPNGRSKVWRPLGFLLLALSYNIIHSIILFYQVITLNVAVNSYSNALLTLLLSVQFVEIKATVFKRFDKENLFQLTLADVVERFQLLLMLVIIASRNLVEMGVWSLSPDSTSSSILPKSFTFFPKWTGQLMGPFFMVIGSEMLVDWLKHAYITKFNNVRPIVYERFLDVQCKDYHSHAYRDQNLTRRLGLPVLPLACLFIRATIQTYHMFLATHVPAPLPPTTSLAEHSTSATAVAGIDTIMRRALSRSSFPPSTWIDDLIAAGTMVVFLLVCFLVFLAVKLALGVVLLEFARRRARGIKARERMNINTGSKRSGAFGVITVNAEQRSRIYEGDPAGEKATADRERKGQAQEMKVEMDGLEGVERYKMVSKRIW